MPESRDTAHELHRHYFVVFLTHLDCREDPKVLLRKVTQHIRVQLHRDDRTPRQPKRTNKRCNVVAGGGLWTLLLSLSLSLLKSLQDNNFLREEKKRGDCCWRVLLQVMAGKELMGLGIELQST